MERAIDANELEMFPYAEVAGTEEQIADWIEQVGLSGDDTASRARNLCWKVIEGFINVVKTQPTLTQPNEWIAAVQKIPKKNAPILIFEDGDMAIATFKDGKFMEYSDTGYPVIIRRPTHWMPLPAPPAKEDQK